MPTIALLLALFVAQAPEPAAPADDPYHVEDPFAIEPAESHSEEAASANATVQPQERPSSERLICRSREDPTTRLRRLRVCLTAAEWRLHETHMEQQRRDINDWGAQGGGPG